MYYSTIFVKFILNRLMTYLIEILRYVVCVLCTERSIGNGTG